jgi:2'-5' RNA ligase
MGEVGAEDPGINSYSLVAYLPEPLAGFVDALRREVQPGSTARGHVTLLPPRPIHAPIEQACSEIAAVIENEHAFDVHLGQVCVFPASGVVHLSIGQGSATLIKLHRALNWGACEHLETFYYHPHVTAAQGLAPDAVTKATEVAVARWSSYEGPRVFSVERVTLVQNTVANEWRNLREFELRTPVITVVG